MLEVPRAEEELALANPKASGLDAEPSPEEGKQEVLTKPRKAGDQLKGEPWGGLGTASGVGGAKKPWWAPTTVNS